MLNKTMVLGQELAKEVGEEKDEELDKTMVLNEELDKIVTLDETVDKAKAVDEEEDETMVLHETSKMVEELLDDIVAEVVGEGWLSGLREEAEELLELLKLPLAGKLQDVLMCEKCGKRV